MDVLPDSLSFGGERLSDSELNVLVEGLARDGYAVTRPLWDLRAVEELREQLHRIYGRQCDEIGGRRRLEAMGEGCVARLPMAYDERFRSVALSASIGQISEAVLGEYCMLSEQTGVMNRPGEANTAQQWHRDLGCFGWLPNAMVALTIILSLDRFDDVSGGTVLIPGSERSLDPPELQAIERRCIAPTVPAGALLVFDALTLHRARSNLADRDRLGVTHVVTVPVFAQQIQIPPLPAAGFSDRDRRFLGETFGVAASPLHWRRRRTK